MFISEESTKTIEVKHLVMDTLSPYNIILGRPDINLLDEVLSALHLSLKYSLPDEQVGSVWGVRGSGDHPRMLAE